MLKLRDTSKHQGLRNQLANVLNAKGIIDENVLNAVRKIPRHLFIDSSFESHAYQDKAFPIAAEQTISMPYTVAFQSQTLEVKSGEKVLEIGTGSGYQAAILGQVVDQVFSVERIDDLTKTARRRFIKLGYMNIRCKTGDGFKGWENEAPYDLIIATAAPEIIPEDLLKQLKIGGIMLLPLGDSQKQNLVKIRKSENGYNKEVMDAVLFVPFLQGVIRK